MVYERETELLWNISKVEEVPGVGGGRRRTRYWVGDNFLIEISSRPVERMNKHDVANIWFKKKRIPRRIKQCLSVTTYFTDKDGMCWGCYNPTHKIEDGHLVLDFSFDYEDSKQAREAILAEAISMWEFDIKFRK